MGKDMIEKITNEDLELYAEKVNKDKKYGNEGLLIYKALSQFPYNHDIEVVAMKIALIDITNGTNLSRNLGKEGGLYHLAQKITKIHFDERVQKGDFSLVEELAIWTKKEIGKKYLTKNYL